MLLKKNSLLKRHCSNVRVIYWVAKTKRQARLLHMTPVRQNPNPPWHDKASAWRRFSALPFKPLHHPCKHYLCKRIFKIHSQKANENSSPRGSSPSVLELLLIGTLYSVYRSQKMTEDVKWCIDCLNDIPLTKSHRSAEWALMHASFFSILV